MIVNPFKRIDLAEKRRESSALRRAPEMSKEINARITTVMVVIAILFFTIIIRLFYLQIYAQEEYQEKLTAYTMQQYTQSSPRGTIYDSNGNILVESVSSLTISYYPPENSSDLEEWELAEKLVVDLGLDNPTIYDRNIRELHIQYLKEIEDDDASNLLRDDENEDYANGNLKLDDYSELKIAAVDISAIDDETRMIYQVKMNMDALPNNTYKVIAEDVSEEQLAIVSENSSKYPGVRCTFDWKRSYSDEGLSVKSLLGSVSSPTQGVPSEEQDYYLALGYDLNQRVGISGLEEQYEQYLSGTESVYNINFDEDDQVYLTQTSAGKNGYDLTLTLDIEYQNHMQELLNKALEEGKSNQYRAYFDNAYLVALNPQTGEIYCMVGSAMYEDEVVANPNGTYLNSYLMGSAIKPAMLYMGQNEGVVYPGQIILDAPMFVKGTAKFASYKNYGLINDVEAIKDSSNVYMAMIAIALGGAEYVENESLDIEDGTFDLMRNYFNMFGLGVATGIDLPNEQVGAIGSDTEPGKIMPYSIGQYDTYTTMQLAQYVATLANGGTRVQPHLLNEVSEVNDLDTIIYAYKTSILGVVMGDLTLLKNSEQGMIECVNSGSCGSVLSASNVGLQLAAKTGTAEVIYIDENTGAAVDIMNSTLIAYEVSDDPTFAVACSAPNSSNGYGSNLQSNICAGLVAEATKEFFGN